MLNNAIPRTAMKQCSLKENLRLILFNLQSTKIMIEAKKKR